MHNSSAVRSSQWYQAKATQDPRVNPRFKSLFKSCKCSVCACFQVLVYDELVTMCCKPQIDGVSVRVRGWVGNQERHRALHW